MVLAPKFRPALLARAGVQVQGGWFRLWLDFGFRIGCGGVNDLFAAPVQ